ncbi:MAG: hypothetical protein QM296_04310 [Bacillota bacterium]|nr:hypothetical protein [Bacillota bacterium]
MIKGVETDQMATDLLSSVADLENEAEALIAAAREQATEMVATAREEATSELVRRERELAEERRSAAETIRRQQAGAVAAATADADRAAADLEARLGSQIDIVAATIAERILNDRADR